jgi:hypothetical protein
MRQTDTLSQVAGQKTVRKMSASIATIAQRITAQPKGFNGFNPPALLPR